MNERRGLSFPLASNDDGADIVETSYLVMGLLTHVNISLPLMQQRQFA